VKIASSFVLIFAAAGCVTPNEQLGARFAFVEPTPADAPLIYVYAGGAKCGVRIHAPNGTFSFPVASRGFLPFRAAAGRVDFDVQVSKRGALFDWLYRNQLEVANGEVHFIRCDVYAVMRERKTDLIIVDRAQALAELQARHEMDPSVVEAW
jgi:hypothetical protein